MFNFIYKNLKLIIILTLSLILIINFKECQNNKNLLKISELNNKALSDTIRISKNKINEEQYRKLELITNSSNLKKINFDLTNEINKLEKKDKNNLVEITKLNVSIDGLKGKIDSISSTVTKINDSVYEIKFDKTNQYQKLIGYSKFNAKNNLSETFLTENLINLDLTINKVKTKDGIEIIVSSSNPYVGISKIDGALLKPESYSELVKSDKKWNVSASIGYGITFNGFQPFLGITIGRTIFKF